MGSPFRSSPSDRARDALTQGLSAGAAQSVVSDFFAPVVYPVPSVVPGAAAEYVGRLAKGAAAPGNNADPTATWSDDEDAYPGALANFAIERAVRATPR